MSYYYRESLYNLVELAILARNYHDSLAVLRDPQLGPAIPSDFHLEATREQLDISFQQTLLKMKATEGRGRLVVAIYGADPVGFYWSQDNKKLAQWVHPLHKANGIEESLTKWAHTEVSQKL